MRLLLILLLGVSFCSAAFAIKLSEYNHDLDKNLRKISKIEHEMDEDYARRENLVATLLAQGGSKDKSPYVELQSGLGRMSEFKTAFKTRKAALDARIAEQRNAWSGKSKISKKDPEWQQLKALTSHVNQEAPLLKASAQQYQAQGKSFGEVMKQNGIGNVDVTKVRKQAQEFTVKLNQFKTDSQSKLIHAKSLSDKINPADKAHYAAALKEVEVLVSEVDQSSGTMLESVNAFLLQVKGKDNVVIGPDTAYYNKFNAAMQNKAALNATFSDLSNKISALNKIIRDQ